jgi:hypothetical protein
MSPVWTDAAKAAAQVLDTRASDVRTWVRTLDSLSGPQSLAALERAFAGAYMPLCNALRDGLRDARAKTACEKFATGFAHVYREASRSFTIRHKLPPLVMDAPDLAAKAAREARVNRVYAVMCDSMRYDVGSVFGDRFAAMMPELRMVSSGILWAGLPTTTSRQLELLARGKEALMEEHVPQSEPSIGRDRTADSVRRARVGSKEIYKLDSVAARILRGQTDTDELGDAAANALTQFLRTKKHDVPHLLYVFGDHGYTFRGDVPTEGSALPEQVLVPYFAYVVPVTQ